MQWRVQLTLRPGRAVLEQHTDALQPQRRAPPLLLVDQRRRARSGTTRGSSTRWSSPRRTASPTSTRGRSTRRARPERRRQPQRTGPVSRFSHGSREPFMGVYHPQDEGGRRALLVADRSAGQEVLVVGQRRRRPRLAPRALRRQQRVRRDPGGPRSATRRPTASSSRRSRSASPSTGCRCATSAGCRGPRRTRC